MSQHRKHRAAAAEVFRQQNTVENDAPQEAQAKMAPPAARPPMIQEEKAQMMDVVQAMGMPVPSPQSPPPPVYRERKKVDTMQEDFVAVKTSEELQLEKEPIQVRETGILLWKRIIVPPNAYVVHTRAGHKEPVTLGLGISFRYNPRTDAYLVVPAAMQTIGVVSNCISKEKQGINVLAYVQWQISDFAVAYRKLDFSDTTDPLGIVNAQLREQADAAIKDKIATMSVEEVLTDKAPVIEELTRRLIEVSEGRVRGEQNNAADGLGIKIVTVQIKEAFVSSISLWENLQAPYRHEQEQIAKISLLNMQEEIRRKQLETRQATETSEAETEVEIARVREEKKTEELELRLSQEDRRKQREQEMQSSQLQREQAIKLEEARLEAETQGQLEALEMEQKIRELDAQRQLAEQEAQIEQQRLTHEAALKQALFSHEQVLQQQSNTLQSEALEAELNRQRQNRAAHVEMEDMEREAAHREALQEAEIARLRQEIQNLINEQGLVQEWIATLPHLAEQMPEVHEMRVLQMGEQQGNLAAFLSQQTTFFTELRHFLKNGALTPEKPEQAE